MRVLTIFGTRPEAIKMAPVIRELRLCPDISCHVCVTGQHREMLDQVLSFFAIQPDTDLNLMASGQDLTDLTSRTLTALKPVFRDVKPDLVLVQGDTTTAFAAALAAYYHQTPIGHIEAGLRTYQKYAPFPEELNRKLVSSLADLHFAPCDSAKTALIAEGVKEESVYVTGNTVIDALKMTKEILLKDAEVLQKLEQRFLFLNRSKRLILVTGHRRENFGHGFESVCAALTTIAAACPDIELVYPVHPNPRVQETVTSIIGSSYTNIHLIKPLDYPAFVYLMDRSYLIMTDSGGVQEEAPYLGKPVIVMREHTERMEAVAAGTVVLTGCDAAKISKVAMRLLTDQDSYRTMSMALNPYGDGDAAQRIVSIIENLQI